MSLRKSFSLSMAASLLCFVQIASAQQTSGLKVADTSSPRDTLRSFLDACNELNVLIQEQECLDRTAPGIQELGWKILDCIDSSEIPAYTREERAGEIAAALKEILDRVELPPWESIPDAEQIEAAGGYEKLSRWRIPDTRITIERVDEGTRKHEYLFSTGTANRALGYFREIEHRPYRSDGPATSPGFYTWYISAPGNPLLASLVQRLPDSIRFGSTLGLANWKWPGLILLLIVAGGLMWLLYSLQASVIRRVSAQQRLRYLATLLLPIMAMLVPLGFQYIADRYLTVRSTPLYVITFSAFLVFLVAAVLTVFSAATRVAESIIASPDINAQSLDAQLIRITSKLLAIMLAVLVLISGAQYLGIPIATLLASAGIGGVAIALGAQDTLKNLFATISLMADKPCRVGDRIRINNYDGFVEDIGLRSTRLRLLDGHLVTVPNDQISGRNVENVSRRDFMRRSGEIHIPFNTTCDKVQRAVEIVREKLTNHEGMNEDRPPRVFFDDFSPSGFRIAFIYWYFPADYWEFKAFGNELNFSLYRAFEAEGIQFSLPQRHSYWQEDDRQGPLEIAFSRSPSTPPHELPDESK